MSHNFLTGGLPPRARRMKHAKSRTGCVVCKQRHIKCDETRPSCLNCTQRSMSCRYTPGAQEPLKLGPGRPRKTAHLLEVPEAKPIIKRSDDLEYASYSDEHSRLEKQQLSLDMADVELLLHYYTGKWATFSDDAPIQRTFQGSISEMALSHPFLLRLLLALSGLHLRHVHSGSKFNHKARHYENLSEKHFAAAIPQLMFLISECSRETCEIAHVAAILVCMYLLARGPVAGEYLVFNQKDSPNLWIGLLQGVKRIRFVFNGAPQQSPTSVTELLYSPDLATVVSSDLPKVRWRSSLRGLKCFIASNVETRTKEMYCTAITALNKSFQGTYGDDESGSYECDPLQKIVFRWLYLLDDFMIERLQDKDPHALIIFAYYAVLLRTPELLGVWFTKGWSHHVLRGIYNLLEERYRPWLKWPFETVGLDW